MTDSNSAVRCRQLCARCGQLMFEYYRSPDGHFGLAAAPSGEEQDSSWEIRCPTCRAAYRLLDRVNSMGEPVERK